jgi:integrase
MDNACPVPESPSGELPRPTMTAPLTLAELRDQYFRFLELRISSGRNAVRTLEYYRAQLSPVIELIGPDKLADKLRADEIEAAAPTRSRVQAIQRLFNWAQKCRPPKVINNEARYVDLPPLGERCRVLTERELQKLMDSSRRYLQLTILFLLMSWTRPQEGRLLLWTMLNGDETAFTLSQFKGKQRRKDGVRVRTIPIIPELRPIVAELRERSKQHQSDYVLLNGHGAPWTKNALVCAFRHLRERVGLKGGESIVPYTLRHTAGTRAAANGVRDWKLAILMGHASPRTTNKYVHLAGNDAIEAALEASRPKHAAAAPAAVPGPAVPDPPQRSAKPNPTET